MLTNWAQKKIYIPVNLFFMPKRSNRNFKLKSNQNDRRKQDLQILFESYVKKAFDVLISGLLPHILLWMYTAHYQYLVPSSI
jgi:hypothetical protein